MKFRVLISIAFFFLVSSQLNAQKLSDLAEISVVTCAPGNELYSTFGHTAIRIIDPLNRFDNVYNYGTFNFETANFYLKFTRGQLDYMLSVSPYKYFIVSYMNENRWIKEQLLDLTQGQKQKIFEFLENNALPENKYYRYDFFYDNCATRVKDVLKDVLGDNLIIPKSVTEDGTTFRDMLDPYLNGKEWERFGINLILGQPADKKVTADEATFLPDFTEMYFDECIINNNGIEKSLVKSKRMLFEPVISSNPSKTFFTPTLLFWLVFILFAVLSLIEFRKNIYFLIADKALFYILGIIGLIILLMWFATDHKAVVNNWDIIWAMPLYFIIAFRIRRNDNLKCFRVFILIWSFILLISLIIDLSFYNMFDKAVIPLILVLLLRSPLHFFYRK